MSADTPFISIPDEEPGFPNTAEWQWNCHYCYRVNTSPSNTDNYGTCRRCDHERCRECKIIWDENTIERSPEPLFRGTEQSIKDNRQLLELGLDMPWSYGGLGKGVISSSRKGVGGAITARLEGESKGQPEVKGNQRWIEFEFDFGGKHNG